MKRRALIIANPGVLGQEDYCAGVEQDVENYRRFLCSPIGGFWDGDDIVTLRRSQVAGVMIEVRRLKSADYAFVVFSGHGCHEDGSTIVELTTGQELDSEELMEGASRQTVILDCCRVVRPVALREAMMLKAMRGLPPLHPAQCRLYYDKRIAECPPSVVVMHACSIGELAGDDSETGGWYSASLLHEARSWAETRTIDTQREFDILSVAGAHAAAGEDVRRKSRNRQIPQIEKARSAPYFPFCIVT